MAVTNRVVDALFRCTHPTVEVLAHSVGVPQWCETIIQGYNSDPHGQELITKLSVPPTIVPNFSFTNRLLKYKSRVWLGSNTAIQQQIIQALHASAVGGHSDAPASIKRVQQFFVWSGLK